MNNWIALFTLLCYIVVFISVMYYPQIKSDTPLTDDDLVTLLIVALLWPIMGTMLIFYYLLVEIPRKIRKKHAEKLKEAEALACMGAIRDIAKHVRRDLVAEDVHRVEN